MSNELLALIVAHFLCNAAAANQVLPMSDVTASDENFTIVKLAFAGHQDVGEYRKMPLAEQVNLNSLGYARYKTWVKENPDIVRDLIELAGKQLAAANTDS